MLLVADRLDHARRYLDAIPGAAERALSRAINVAGEAARATAEAAILERYVAKPSDVRQALRITTSRPATLALALSARSRPLSVGYFPHTPSAPGTGGKGKATLAAEIKRGASKGIRGAFIANLASGPRVMTRTPKGLRSLYTIPIAGMLGAGPVRDAVEAEALQVLDEALPREIDRELVKAGAA